MNMNFVNLLKLDKPGLRSFVIDENGTFNIHNIASNISDIAFHDGNMNAVIKEMLPQYQEGKQIILIGTNGYTKNGDRHNVSAFTLGFVGNNDYAYKITNGVTIMPHASFVTQRGETDTELQPEPMDFHELMLFIMRASGYDCLPAQN